MGVRAAGAVWCAVVVAVCGMGIARGDDEILSPTGDFYAPVTAEALVSTAAGAVVRAETLPVGADVFGLARAARVSRIVYVSRDSHDRAVTATGAVLTPRAAWTGAGARPLVGLAAGAHGLGPQCAQSLGLSDPVRIGAGPDLALAYEIPSIAALLGRGYAVAVTDYLRADGVETFLNRLDAGHALLDVVRAARTMPDVDANAPVALWGYSQGGGAAAAAAELHPRYAPELPVRAVYAGAVPADLPAVLRASETTLGAGFGAWVIASALASDPGLWPPVAAVSSAAGLDAIARARGECLGAMVARGALPSAAMTVGGASLTRTLSTASVFVEWFERQRLGDVAPVAPVLVHAAPADDLVPFSTQLALVDSWRSAGATVDLLTFDAPPIAPGMLAGHSLAHQLDTVRPLDWLDAHLRN